MNLITRCVVWIAMVSTANLALAEEADTVQPKGTATSPASNSPSELNFKGTWQAGAKGVCKELRCVARPVGGDKWEATFTGVCTSYFSFKVKMKGQQQGDEIVFEEKTNLGELLGGVYTWRGVIADEKFTGKYDSTGGKRGTFEMKPLTPAEIAAEAEAKSSDKNAQVETVDTTQGE